MAPKMPWHLWPGRGWPLTADEEAAFVTRLDELREDSDPKPVPKGVERWDRVNIIAMVTALRTGTDADQLLSSAPGLCPHQLVDAYRRIEAERAEAVAAWNAVVDAPSSRRLHEQGERAATLLPVPVGRLAQVAEVAPERLEEEAARFALRVREVGAVAAETEAQLARYTPPSEAGVAHGRRLFDPFEPCLWGAAYYLADRVGTITPMRLVDLLGERRDDPHLL